MARLPVAGSDDGTWGTVLNDFLMQSHTSTGALTSSAISNAGSLLVSNNLSDITSASTARTNLSAPQASGFATITVGATAPSSPAVGDVWIDTN
jgi:hypothetical protein